MNLRDVALSLDAEGNKPVEAVWAYELATRTGDAELELFLNLAAIYFSANDVGFAAAHGLDTRFVDVAYYRAVEVLKDAESRFGAHPETSTWLLYLEERVIGQEPDPGTYETLSSQPGAMLAHLLIEREPVDHGTRGERMGAPWNSDARSTERGRYMTSLATSRPRRVG
jgi:hypothetical protein